MGRIIPMLTVVLVLLHASAQAQITGMRAGSGAARVRIVLDMDSPAKFKESSTRDRITLDIDTAVTKKLQQVFDDASVKDVSVEKTGKKTSRLQISLKKPAQHKVLVLKKPNRLVIDVYRIQIVKITKNLGGGLSYTYWQDDMSGLPVRLYVLSMAPVSNYELRPFSGAGNANGRGRLARATASLATVNGTETFLARMPRPVARLWWIKEERLPYRKIWLTGGRFPCRAAVSLP